jgi:hypothetical protein
MFLAIGGLFAALGFTVLVRIVRRRRLVAWLREHGTRVSARFVDIERKNYSVYGQNPWCIRAEWSGHDGRLHSFVSAAIWDDPSPHLKGVKNVDVLIDPADPRRHCVGLPFATEKRKG